jgi:hypothetical protein
MWKRNQTRRRKSSNQTEGWLPDSDCDGIRIAGPVHIKNPRHAHGSLLHSADHGLRQREAILQKAFFCH